MCLNLWRLNCWWWMLMLLSGGVRIFRDGGGGGLFYLYISGGWVRWRWRQLRGPLCPFFRELVVFEGGGSFRWMGSGFLVGGGCFQWGRWFRGEGRSGFRWWLMEEDEEGRNF